VVSPGFEARDPQEHGEREEGRCTGDGAQDAGLGGAVGEPLSRQAEAGSAEQRQQEPDDGGESSGSAVELRERVEQLLPVLLHRLDADDRARTAPSPGGDGGSRDGDVLGQASGAAADHLLPEAMVVRAARPRHGREGVHQHEDSTARGSTTSQNPNDIRGADVAYTKTRNVCARSWARCCSPAVVVTDPSPVRTQQLAIPRLVNTVLGAILRALLSYLPQPVLSGNSSPVAVVGDNGPAFSNRAVISVENTSYSSQLDARDQ